MHILGGFFFFFLYRISYMQELENTDNYSVKLFFIRHMPHISCLSNLIIRQTFFNHLMLEIYDL